MQTRFVLANMANNNDDDLRHHMLAQEQAFRAQQDALDSIQCMFSWLMTYQNNKENFDNSEREEENRTPENKNTKESSSSPIDAEVIKGIQAQIASLTQRDELKKVGITCSYPL